MLLRKQRIRLLIPQLRIHIDARLEMIQKAGALAHIPRRAGGVPHEPPRRRAELAAFPRVVGGLAGDDDGGALGDERPGGFFDVGVEGEDGFAVLAGLAGLGAGAGAVGATVVGGRVGGAAIVVAEFDDDDVAGLEEFFDLGEAPFVGVAAGGAAGDGFIHDRDGDVFGEVGAPSCGG